MRLLLAFCVCCTLGATSAALLTLEEGFHHDIDETTVSVGVNHACALEAVDGLDYGGKPVCWGAKKFNRLKAVNDLYIQLSAGEYATCGVNLEEKVRCWGQHAMDPPSSMSFLQVSCGSYHCCGILHDSSIHCWGMDFMGQLDAPKEGKFVQVSSGFTHVCALTSKGTVECWGDETRRATVPPSGQFVQLSCREHECCGLRLDGTLACWGSSVPEGQDL